METTPRTPESLLGDIDWRNVATLRKELPRLEARLLATGAGRRADPCERFFLSDGHVYPRSPALRAPASPGLRLEGPSREAPAEMLCLVERRMRPGAVSLVGVTGAPGSGKSVVAQQLADGLRARGSRCAVVELDGYLLPRAEREHKVGREIFDQAAWARDHSAIRAHPDTPLELRSFDHATGALVARETLVPSQHDVLIVEGVLSRPEENDVTIGVYADDPSRLTNMLARSPTNADRLRTIYWQHQLALLPEICSNLERADLVVVNDFGECGDAPPTGAGPGLARGLERG